MVGQGDSVRPAVEDLTEDLVGAGHQLVGGEAAATLGGRYRQPGPGGGRMQPCFQAGDGTRVDRAEAVGEFGSGDASVEGLQVVSALAGERAVVCGDGGGYPRQEFGVVDERGQEAERGDFVALAPAADPAGDHPLETLWDLAAVVGEASESHGCPEPAVEDFFCSVQPTYAAPHLLCGDTGVCEVGGEEFRWVVALGALGAQRGQDVRHGVRDPSVRGSA